MSEIILTVALVSTLIMIGVLISISRLCHTVSKPKGWLTFALFNIIATVDFWEGS